MSTFQLLLVCIAGVIVVAMLVEAVKESARAWIYSKAQLAAPGGPPPSIFAELTVGEQAAFHTSDGQMIRGAVAKVEREFVELTGAAIHSEGVETKLPGHSRVPVEPIVLVQAL